MYATDYLPQVAWRFKVEDVIFLTEATTENPATYRTTAIPFDSNDPGAREATKSIGHYVVDNVGHCYKVIAVGTTTVDIEDSFNCGVGPQTGKWAYLAESVGEGTAPFISPIYYRHLDKSARDYLRRIELDILWKHRLFTYVAYASDASGAGFTLVNDPDLDYIAFLVSPVEIINPIVDDFVGLWRTGGSGGQVNSDWDATSGVEEILNVPTLVRQLGELTTNGAVIKTSIGIEVDPTTGWNNSVQPLSGVTPTFNPSAGLHFNMTVSTIPTITFTGLVAGMSGNISILNASGVRMTFTGYTFHISQAVYYSTNQVQLSGSTNTDKFTWYYDGSVVTINGTLDVKTT